MEFNEIINSLENQQIENAKKAKQKAEKQAIEKQFSKVVSTVEKSSALSTRKLLANEPKVTIKNKDYAKDDSIRQITKSVQTLTASTREDSQQITKRLVESFELFSNKLTDLQGAVKGTDQAETLNALADTIRTGLVNLNETIVQQLAEGDQSLLNGLAELSSTLSKIDFAPVINVPDPKVIVKTEEKAIDLTEVIDVLNSLRFELSKEQPKDDSIVKEIKKQIAAVNKVVEAISSLSFPASNYILPFKDASGAATQAQVNTDGSLKTTAKIKDSYAIQAKSNDGTYTYYFRENATPDYALMRKHDTTGVWSFAKGTGSYTTVYVDESSAPTGSPTWGTYGAIF